MKRLSDRNPGALLKTAGVTVAQPYPESSAQFSLFRVADPACNVLEFAGKP